MSFMETIDFGNLAPPPLPPWFQEGVVDKFRGGVSAITSVFLLHGDVACLVPNVDAEKEPNSPYLPLYEHLYRVFDKREIVIFYDIANGMRFPKKGSEEKFRILAEINEPDDDGKKKDPVAAARAKLAAKKPLPRDPESCLPLIEKVLQRSDSVAVVIESVHMLAPETVNGALTPMDRVHVQRIRSWAQDRRGKNPKNIVILLADLATRVSNELRQPAARIGNVFIPKPKAQERLLFLKHLPAAEDFKKDEFKEFVNATQGMSLRQILEVFRSADQAKQAINLSFVKKRKQEILNTEYGDVMEICEPQWSLDQIGGLAKAKAYFEKILNALKNGDPRNIPQGLTVMGPPGTGKTALIEALAQGASYNFVKMKNARSMWVGMSEERTERQIQGLWALAPVIVMNDEADLGEANRDAPKGDSGVSERIMQAWMRFLSDPRVRGRIVMVNCTNRPDRMDAAMKRSGRSDDRIAILMPSPEERAMIFKVMFKRYDIPYLISDWMKYAWMTNGLSGADIESITLRSFRAAGDAKLTRVDDQILTETIADFIPPATQDDIDLMTLLAISESSSRSLLPQNTADIIDEIRTRNLVPGGLDLIDQIEKRVLMNRDISRASDIAMV